MRSRGYDRLDEEEDIRSYILNYRPGVLRGSQVRR
jgi:hypothetical protein